MCFILLPRGRREWEGGGKGRRGGVMGYVMELK